MPPKNKFTREEIIRAALQLTRQEGIGAVTARSLADKLGVSPKPIFGIFENMAEVRNETVREARKIYNGYITLALNSENPFREVGKQYIMFSANEPKLFQLLFMTEKTSVPDLSSVLLNIDDNYQRILSSITDSYGLKNSTALNLYTHLWIYTHGIATLIATKMCNFTEDEISKMMSEIFIALLQNEGK